MTYLITGGCGFIGSHIAEALLAHESDAQVVILDNLRSGYEHNIEHLRDRVDFIKGDVRDPESLMAVMAGTDYVFHEAALVSVFESVDDPRANHEINITGVLNVLEAARAAGVRRVVFAASAAAYGDDPEIPKREGILPRPESPYAMAKVAGEYYLKLYAKLYGLETVSLRYFNVYGPRQDPSSMYSGVISKFTHVMAKMENPTVFGDGLQTRDFVYVKDVARANLLAMKSSAVGRGEVINIATGQSTSLLELLHVLGEIFGFQPRPDFVPARSGDVKHSLADISKARKVLGYHPEVSLDHGLRELVKSMNASALGT